ncbi:MAG TPA: LacI family transcriptional regulator [Trueperaceae bacterium]|nr:LacI family transcriptional regulator [Trueperaceae bacterium]
MKQPTQTDVAQAAGVSRATVSYVLNERYNSAMPISTKTKEKVLKAVQDLGYQPDARARSLRSGKTQTLGLIIPNLHNPHHWEIVEGAMQKAHQLGYEILFSSSDLESQKEENSIKALFRRSVDGIILLPTFIKLYPELLHQISELQLPVVMIGCRQIEIDCIGSIDTNATKNAVKHLEDLGHSKISFLLADENQTSGEDRLQPYFDSLAKDKKAILKNQIIRSKSTIEDAYQSSLKLLSRANRPTAIVAVNDYFALGVLRAAKDLNISIPNDLSLIGFDDVLLANYTTPRLTTVRLEAKAVGEGAVEILLNRLKNRTLAIQRKRIPAKLIIRESTAKVQS